jgi:hypothetical protein
MKSSLLILTIVCFLAQIGSNQTSASEVLGNGLCTMPFKNISSICMMNVHSTEDTLPPAPSVPAPSVPVPTPPKSH